MAYRPLIAIVGRTNVGKSSLFNRLARQRLAVVDDYPGVTRDRVYAEAELGGRPVLLVDTGGLAGAVEDELFTRVREQAIAALGEADVVLFVVDAREGLVPMDHEAADAVRRAGKPVVFVANKAESPRADITDFAQLGFGQPIAVSALHGQGVGEIVEQVLGLLPPEEEEEAEEEDAVAIALIGRPNAGKSSILNYLVGEERTIVSEAPGTTRDAVDTVIEREGRRYRLVDTAGMVRRFKQAGGLPYYAALRALRAIERSDVAVLVLDALEGPSAQDARLAGETMEMGRGLVLCAHKWDAVLERALQGEEELSATERRRQERLLRGDYERMIRDRLSFAAHAPLLFTSVVTGRGMEKLLPLAARVGEAVSRRVETGHLNRLVQAAVAKHSPPAPRGRPLHILYATQVAVKPPTVVLFVNDPRLVTGDYQRYLVNYLREKLYGPGVPLRLYFRARRRKQPSRKTGR